MNPKCAKQSAACKHQNAHSQSVFLYSGVMSKITTQHVDHMRCDLAVAGGKYTRVKPHKSGFMVHSRARMTFVYIFNIMCVVYPRCF